jgi:hypothetical protein
LSARREALPNSAAAHFRLGLWCEQQGLKGEAMEQFAAALDLDTGYEAVWKHLRFRRYHGRWLTEDRIASALRETESQAFADRAWEPRLRMWKTWLTNKAKRDEAELALGGVTDPRAIPSVWKVFATGRNPDQQRAVQLLGQIESRASSRALALLAVSGLEGGVRQAATETLRSRDPLEFADLLIALLRDPVQYQLRPVGGPGLPGSLTITGAGFNLERIYAPPPPRDIAIIPGEAIVYDSQGFPIIVRHTDATTLPFAWLDDHGYTYASGCIIPPHVPVTIQLGRMWLENWKSAHSAQQQMRGDIAAIEQANDLQRAADARIVQVLNQATGQSLPVERATWRRWWFARLGRTDQPASDPPRPTLTEWIPLP